MSVSHGRPAAALLRWSVALLVSIMSSLFTLAACLVARYGVLVFNAPSSELRWLLGIGAAGVIVMCFGIWLLCDYTTDLVVGVVSPDEWVDDHLLELGSRQRVPGTWLVPMLVVCSVLWYATDGQTVEDSAFECLLATACVGSAHIGIFVWPRLWLQAWASDALRNRRATDL